MTEKKLFLLDAYALIYRAHFAFTKNPRINSRGINTSVPFGFTNTLLEVITKQKPTHIGVAFDTAAKTFRDEIFEAYKATRQETPEDIRTGVPVVKEIIRGFGIPILEKDGFEADDIIGTLALQAAAEGFTVYMMTPDKDYGQLVRHNIFLYKPAYMGNSVDILGPAEVCEKWDIQDVAQVVDILGLQGDTSDNIPGIPGVGPKTAADLIKQFGSVEEVVKNAGQLKGKLKERVEAFGDQALLSKKLATIAIDVPVAFDAEALVYTGPQEVLRPLLEELEFKTMLPRIFSNGGETSFATTLPRTVEQVQLSMFEGPQAIPSARALVPELVQYTLADTPALRATLVEKLLRSAVFSVMLEKSSDHHFDFSVAGLAFAVQPGEAWYVPDAQQHLPEFAGIFANPRIEKVGYQMKDLLIAFRKAALHITGPFFDTVLAHYLIEPEASHDLGILSKQYAGYTLSEGLSTYQRYCEQADLVLQMRQSLLNDLEVKRHTLLLRDVETPLMEVLAAMEVEGVKLDTEALRWMSDGLRKDTDTIQREIFQLAGMEFNIGSPKQLGEVLFDKMKLLTKAKKTKTGQYATGEEVLIKLAGEHAIAQKILEYREYDKLRNTYVEALPRMISPSDGRVHTDYRQTVAATGRLSSNNPNLQNIPIRTERGRQIRSAFVARHPDYRFMSADYSQIELRIAASFAQDETMIEAFRLKRDIHSTTAARVFHVPLEKVTADMRRKAKEVNFGILYGSTAFGLSQNLGISKTEAADIIDSYFREFPGIKRYMDDSINFAREKEFVETILGRRRYLRDINSRNITTRGFAERNAINAPIQGSAADIIKIAMVNIQRWLEKERLKTRMILQVHDELVFDVYAPEEAQVRERVIELMKHAVVLEVPMEVEVGVGANWLEAH